MNKGRAGRLGGVLPQITAAFYPRNQRATCVEANVGIATRAWPLTRRQGSCRQSDFNRVAPCWP